MAEGIIARFYARLGRAQPRALWFEDPLSCVLACNLLSSVDVYAQAWGEFRTCFAPLRFLRPVGGRIRANLWSRLDQLLHDEVQPPPELAAIGSLLQVRLETTFWPELEAKLGIAHAREVRAQAYAQLRVGSPSRLAARLARHVSGFWGGTPHGALDDVAAPTPASARLAALQGACGWWSPRERAVICSDLPRDIFVDATSLLHHDRGPALELARDSRFHAWHGQLVPSAWIDHREQLSPMTLLHWPLRDERRAGFEIMGWAKLLESVPQQVIDADRDPRIGTLVDCTFPLDGLRSFLHVRCGTGRQFALSVPHTMRTALQANAWTYGLAAEDYQLEART